MNNMSSQSIEIESVIKKVKENYLKVLELYQRTSLDTVPLHNRFVSNYPSFSAMKKFDGNVDFIGKIDKKIGIYIHFPFCEDICDYCYFVKVVNEKKLIQQYIEALKKEIRFYAKHISKQSPVVEFIYFGGGTPTAIKKSFLKEIVKELKASFTISENVEFTCEGSPNTLDKGSILFLKKLGVNRISVGVQSFDATVLREMNRKRTSDKTNTVIENLQNNFKNFNVDFIFGHYASDKDKLYEDLKKVAEYQIPSATFYQIWLNCETLAKAKSNDLSFENLLYQRMVISTFMKELGYINDKSDWYIKDDKFKFKFQDHKWKNGDFIAIGTNSYGYINGVFYRNFCHNSLKDHMKSIKDYIDLVENKEHGIDLYCKLNETEQKKRGICLGLKMNEYLKYDNNVFQPVIDELREMELMIEDDNGIKLSEKGFYMANIISNYLLDYIDDQQPKRTEKIFHSKEEYRDKLTDDIGVCKKSFFSISRLRPDKWLIDSFDISEYFLIFKKFIEDVPHSVVGRITIVDKNMLKNHFKKMLENTYADNAKIYLTHNELHKRLKDTIFKRKGYELLIDTLIAFRAIHKNDDMALLAWNESDTDRFLTYQWEEFDEILIYDNEKVCGIKLNIEDTIEDTNVTEKIKYVEFTGSNVVLEFKNNWFKLKRKIKESDYYGKKLDDYINDILDEWNKMELQDSEKYHINKIRDTLNDNIEEDKKNKKNDSYYNGFQEKYKKEK